ncbi:Ice-binding protein [Flavobacteriaceae bacterium]
MTKLIFAGFFDQKEIKTNYSILKDSQEFFSDKLCDTKPFIYLNTIVLPFKVKVLSTLIILFFMGISNSSKAQTIVTAPELNDLDFFMLYSAGGALNSFGTTTVSGNIGTHAGLINNFTVAENTKFIGDALTLSCYNRLLPLRDDLISVSYTLDSNSGVGALTSGKTFLRGRHKIGMATTIDGTLTLDAQGNADSVFIIHVVGALSIHSGTIMVLANGAKAANVFWVADGAVEFLQNTVSKGTFIGGGIMDVLAGSSVQGRIFTTAGAMNIYDSSLALASNNLVTLPIIEAVADTTSAVSAITGGDTVSLTLNDLLDGVAVVIGTDPGNVILTGVTVPAGLTLNANGTVTVAPNTAEGNYSLTYKICEVTNSTNCSTVTSTIVVTTPPSAGTIDCAKTQIIQAPIQGVPNQVTLVVTMNVTTAGDFPVTLSGSGMSLANGITQVTTSTTGVQTFNIPMKYDGTTLGTLTFGVGSYTCTADLSLTKKKALIDVWTLDNCTIKIAPPTLK